MLSPKAGKRELNFLWEESGTEKEIVCNVLSTVLSSKLGLGQKTKWLNLFLFHRIIYSFKPKADLALFIAIASAKGGAGREGYSLNNLPSLSYTEIECEFKPKRRPA